MALKRQHEMQATFSMASMTDIIFLLLVFFMVTSTYIFPTAIEVNLPQGTEQTAAKPSARVFIDSIGYCHLSIDDEEPAPITPDSLITALGQFAQSRPDSLATIAVYADIAVRYGKVVEILNAGAAANLKMVLATQPTTDTQPTAATTDPNTTRQ